MPLGALAAVIDYSGVSTEEFNDWYDTEHIPERLSIPGFLKAQRWLAPNEPNLSLAFYDLEGIGTMSSPEYLAIAGQQYSPWSKQILDQCARFDRYEAVQVSPGDVISPDGAAALWLVRMNVDPAAEVEFNEWYDTEHLPALSAVPGVIAARRFKTTAGPHSFFAVYHVDAPTVPGGPEWLEAAETPWTLEIRKKMSDRQRTLFLPYGGLEAAAV